MGLRGPLPNPATLKRLTGNPGGRPVKTLAPLDQGTPTLPGSLGPVGTVLWKELIAELSHRRTLIPGDRRILEATCMAYQDLMAATKVIEEKGGTYESDTANGTMIRPRPECQLRSDAFRRYVRCLDALGMTPNSRMRLQILQVPDRTPEEDAFDEFFPPTNQGARP